ncbi:MAG: glycosyltransferase family 39 protein [Proteobacteria bacterium]|nr:glycosyltransferase family 39 protein [Pseudomonadota bacterium]
MRVNFDSTAEVTLKKSLLGALVLLLLFVVITLSISRVKSNTWDESAHLMAGYAYVEEGMDYLSPLNHPVTGRAISALGPSLLYDLDFDKSVKPEGAPGSDFFQYSLKFLFENSVPGTKILTSARAGTIIVGCLLLVFVYLWSYRLWGVTGALVSVLFTALSPNILAHSALATTDLPITAFFFISTYFLWRLSGEEGTLLTSLLAALFIAAALTTKHSALFLMPIFVAAFIVRLRASGLKQTLGLFIPVLVLVYFFIWTFYAFRFHSPGAGYMPLDWARFDTSAFAPLYDFIRAFKLLPESYLYGVAGVVSGASTGRAAFLMGEYSGTGWWQYFTVAFLLKTPIPTLFLFAASVIYYLKSMKRSASGLGALWLLLPVLMLFVLVSAQNVNIGLRHLLPIYPFIFVMIGSVTTIKTESVRLAKRVLVIAIAWYVVVAGATYPHQLAYFNEFIGNPDNGYKYLVDSNLDWGQDLPALKEFMVERDIKRIKLAYFGFSDPKQYGIEYDYLPSYYMPMTEGAGGDIELEGWFAISATMLQGVYLPNRDMYRFFREREPEAVLGHSIFIYKF